MQCFVGGACEMAAQFADASGAYATMLGTNRGVNWVSQPLP
jgi:hypothetical protein